MSYAQLASWPWEDSIFNFYRLSSFNIFIIYHQFAIRGQLRKFSTFYQQGEGPFAVVTPTFVGPLYGAGGPISVDSFMGLIIVFQPGL